MPAVTLPPCLPGRGSDASMVCLAADATATSQHHHPSVHLLLPRSTTAAAGTRRSRHSQAAAAAVVAAPPGSHPAAVRHSRPASAVAGGLLLLVVHRTDRRTLSLLLVPVRDPCPCSRMQSLRAAPPKSRGLLGACCRCGPCCGCGPCAPCCGSCCGAPCPALRSAHCACTVVGACEQVLWLRWVCQEAWHRAVVMKLT
jgi:hypothetical protein